ncbi:stage V sporulation protein B [Clostridium ihumii]|uniref:stage V sporulation protein B n=1 Tax=Clostridium ihumii TaxID=1470356 RepID=UPI00058F1970|nr:stage V sporulation protein B [Clostridium ihumii]
MGSDNFYRDTFVLTISNLTMAIIRFIFSIILSDKLGPEGVGLYGLIMPIYDLFCCLVCGGIVAAISKEVSSYHGTGSYKNMNKSVRYNFAFLLLWSIFVTVIMFISAPLITKYVIKDPRTLYSLWILCPAIIFIALSSILKGYFFGVMEVNTPAIIDIVEKALRLFITLSLIDLLLLKDITTTVTATYASFTIGEFVSFVLLYIFFKRSSKKFTEAKSKDKETENGAQLLYNSFKTAFPLAVNGFLTTAITSASTLLIPRRLIVSGMTYNMALESIGKFSGMALTIIFFPLVIVNSMATILVPDISQSLTKKDYKSIGIRVNEVIKMCFILGVSIMIICFMIPDNLGLLFYKRNDLSSFIKSAAISVPFLYASSCTYGILNGLGKQKKILINSILTSVIELVIMYFLMAIPKINIYGFAIGLFVSSLLGFILNLIEINKTVKLSINLYEILVITALSLICIFTIKILNATISNDNFLIKNIILFAISFVLFFGSIFTIRKTSTNSNVYY